MAKRIWLSAIAVAASLAAAGAAEFNVLPAGSWTSIQAAIDAARDGDSVVVHPGVYVENISFGGKTIAVRSVDPMDRDVTSQTVIEGGGTYGGNRSGPVVTFSGQEGADALLSGFTIRAGFTDYRGGGISGYGTPATISHCVIEENEALSNGSAIHACNGLISHCIIRNNMTHGGGALAGCNGRIVNCLIVGNEAVGPDAMASAIHNCDGQILNCTIADNTTPTHAAMERCDGQIVNCIISGVKAWRLDACSIPQNSCYPGARQNGNIDADPGFLAAGEYYLTRSSPCIDAGTNLSEGLPATDIDGHSRTVDGSGCGQARVDIGAYEYDPQLNYIQLSAHAIEFNAIEGRPFHDSRIITIANAGVATLNWMIEGGSQWLTVAPNSGQAGPDGAEITLTVDAPALSKGKFACPLTVTDPLALNSPQTIMVMLYIRVEGQLSVPAIYPTIQSAIDGAVDGDLIIVDDGTYSGEGNINLDFKGKAITLRSENGPDKCIIDCQNEGRGFFFHTNEGPDSVVEGFTVTNGLSLDPLRIPSYQREACAGGAVCILQASPMFIDCRFVRCSVEDLLQQQSNGGGMYCGDGSPTLIRCRFLSNAAGAGGGFCSGGQSDPKLMNCIFSGNMASSGSAIAHLGGSMIVINCTVTGNRSSYNNVAAVRASGWDSNMVLSNCVVWANSAGEGSFTESAQVSAEQSAGLRLYHNCIQGWTGQLGGVGNIGRFPRFVDPGRWMAGTSEEADDMWIDGDYHLKSEGWRWDGQSKRWTYDDVTSLCIDAGNPATPLGDEPQTLPLDPFNEWGENVRVNMGAYGGTAEASMAPPGWSLLCDITNDHVVDLADLVFVASRWLWTDCTGPGWCRGTDLDRNGDIALTDLGLFAGQWRTRSPLYGALAHWHFDGNFYDSAGGWDGTPVGDPPFVSASLAAEGSGALSLNGDDQRVRIDGFYGIGGSQSRTLCAWIKTLDREGAVIAWGLTEVLGGRWVWRTQEDGFMHVGVGGGSITGSTFVCDDRWHHVAVVFQSDDTPGTDDVRLFVDGREDPPADVVPQVIDTVITAAPPVRIGFYNLMGYPYEGLIDDLRIYDRALSVKEIAELAK